MPGLLARMMPRSLAARIGAALALVGVLPGLVVWGATLMEARAPKAVDQYFLLLADYAAQSVRHDLEEGATAVQAVAQDGVISGNQGSRAAVEDRLRQFNGLYPLFQHLTLVDLEGRPLASSTYRYSGEWRRLTVFQLAASGEVAISPAHLSLGSREPLVSLAAPVRDSGDQVVAVLVGQVPVASVAPLVVGLQAGRGGYAFLVNSVGQVIAHPDPERLMRSWDWPGPEAPSSPALLTAKESDRDYLYAVAPVAAKGMLERWQVVLRAPTEEAYAYFIRTQRLTLFLALGTLMVIGLLATGLALAFSRPVRRLTAAARQMARGDLSVRVEGPSAGELGELARAFNSMAQELRAKIQALQDSRARIVTVQEGVRREIAAHLHGRVQGRLLALKGLLQELAGEPGLPPPAAQLLGEVVDHLDQVIGQEVSPLSRRLYPSILRQGLVPALQSLGDQFEAALAVEIELDEGLVQRERADRSLVPELVRLTAYRIAEESLTNAVKHAQASRATLRLDLPRQGGLRLTVQDNGQGFEVGSTAGGLGMAAMQDYAEAVGGRCVVRSAPGQGTTVAATLPLPGLGAGPLERASP